MIEDLSKIAQSKVIAVLRNIPEDRVLKVIEALLEGGVKTMEITFGSPNTEEIIKKSIEAFGKDLLVGAGTVLTEEEVDRAVEAGAKFIFSPNYDEKVVKRTLYNNVISIPGAITPSEIYQAHLAGAHAVKVFPAQIVGANFIKDLAGPLPFIKLIPTGGIDKNNIAEFLNAGALAVGMGGSLLLDKYIQEEDYQALTDHAKEVMKRTISGS